MAKATATQAAADTVAVTTVPAIDPTVVKAATAVIGAVGTFSEYIGTQGQRYFTSLLDAAGKAITVVGPSITAGMASWQALNPKSAAKNFTADVWVGQVAAQRPDGWTPNVEDRRRLDILFTLATNDHSAATQAHYIQVCANDVTGTYGIGQIDGYLKWLPIRGEYENGVRTQAAIDAEKAEKVLREATQAAKDAVVLVGYGWDTVAPAATWTDTTARDEHLAKLLHDFEHYVTSTIASHDAGDGKYIGTIRRSVSAAVKARQQAMPTTPRAAQ